MPATTVYVWYPNHGHIGHASMHIGGHRERNSIQWYVSWWPNESTKLSTKVAEPATFDEDIDNEDGDPHVKYRLFDLHVGNMKAAWDGIRDKAEAHYKLLGKNCSTIVARIMRAGGAEDHLGTLTGLSVAHNLYWTPKNVAEFCDALVKAGKGKKEKHHSCPLKSKKIGDVLLGLR